MLLRYLKRARSRSPISPPSWGPHGPPDTPELRRDGSLTSVLLIGSRLSVSIRFQGHDYVALLEEWNPPPSVEQVLGALTTAVGQSVQQVAGVDVGSHLPVTASPIPATTLSVPNSRLTSSARWTRSRRAPWWSSPVCGWPWRLGYQSPAMCRSAPT